MSAWTTENRRRLWQQFKILGIKALESQGAETEPFAPKYDTRPAQNNSDLSWDACEYAPKALNPENGFTEMTYSLLQVELAILSERVHEDDHPLLQDVKSYVDFQGSRLEREKERINVKCLKDLDLSDPI